MKIIITLILLSYLSLTSASIKIDTNSVCSESREYTYLRGEDEIDTTKRKLTAVKRYYKNGFLKSHRTFNQYSDNKSGGYVTYDDKGRIISSQLLANESSIDHKELYEYDDLGKLVTITKSWPNKPSCFFSSDRAEAKSYFIYNDRGLLDKEEHYTSTGAISYDFIYAYDKNDSLLSKTYNSYDNKLIHHSNIKRYFRNEIGKLDSTQDRGIIRSRYEYNEDGSYIEKSYGDSVIDTTKGINVSTYYYNSEGLLLKSNNSNYASVYHYNDKQMKTRHERFRESNLYLIEEYSYDDNNRLIEINTNSLAKQSSSVLKNKFNENGHLIEQTYTFNGKLLKYITYEYLERP